MKPLALLLLALPMFGQTLNMSMSCPPQAKPGAQVSCTVTVTGNATANGVAYDGQLVLTSGAAPVAWTITTTIPSKTVSAAPGASNIFVLSGLNQTVIGQSTVATVAFTMPPAPVSYQVAMGAAVDASGGVITVTTNPPAIVAILSTCDENGDGIVNQADYLQAVQNIISGPVTQQALSVGLSNAQKDVNAIPPGTCTR